MTDKQERIAAKIRKILNIAEDDAASAEEIQNAMNHAKRLMDSHHLTMEDLGHEPEDDYQKVDQANMDQCSAFVGKKVFLWESMLSLFVSEFVGVPVYATSRPQKIITPAGLGVFDDKGQPKFGKAFVFYGVAEDAAIAVELFNELRQMISTLALGKWGTIYKGDGATYAEGFVNGLNTQLRQSSKIEQQTSTTSMILLSRRDDLIKYKEKKAANWLSTEHNIRLRSGNRRPGSRTGSHSAYSEGRSDGSRADVSATRRRKIN